MLPAPRGDGHRANLGPQALLQTPEFEAFHAVVQTPSPRPLSLAHPLQEFALQIVFIEDDPGAGRDFDGGTHLAGLELDDVKAFCRQELVQGSLHRP
jgi:hypothetical protein